MTAPRNITTHWSGGTGQADITLPTCLAGDLLIILVGGGNQVVATPSGWTAYGSLTGQEAQGKRFTKVADGSESGDPVSIYFDGNDQRYVVALAVRDWDDHDLNDYERIGTAGGTYPAGDHTWTADTYQGDLVITFSFARNADTAPTMSRGVLWDSQATDGSSAALYLESAPTYEVGADYAITYPERSGHVSYSMAVYARTALDWFTPPAFETVIEASQLEGLTESQADSDQKPETTITRDEFTALQDGAPFQGAGTGNVTIASWGYNIVTGIPGPDNMNWHVYRGFQGYGRRLDDDEKAAPDPPDLPPDLEEMEFEEDAPTVISQLFAEGTVADWNLDDTTGTDMTTDSPDFATAWRTMTDLTFVDGFVDAQDWPSPSEPGGTLMHLREAAAGVSDGSTTEPFTIDITAAITDPVGEWQFVSYASASSGSGIPRVDLRNYGASNGGAAFGAVFDVEWWHVWLQTGMRRYIVRRGPVVDIIPKLVRYLRNYPRDDAYGFGNTSRNYPPPRRLRNYGKQP